MNDERESLRNRILICTEKERGALLTVDRLEREKSNQTIKGDLIKSAFLTSTMGVSYKLKLPKNI